MDTKEKIGITPDSKIFTTGAYLQAIEVEINGVKQWRWVLVGQEGDAFYDGESIVVCDYSNSFKGLFQAE